MQRQGGSVFTFRKCAGIFLSSIYILVNESVHKAWCRTHIYNILYVEGHESPAKGNTTTCIRSFLANIEYVCWLLAAAPQISDLALTLSIYIPVDESVHKAWRRRADITPTKQRLASTTVLA